MALNAITEAGEDNNLFAAANDVTNSFNDGPLLGLVQRRPDLHQPRQELRVIWPGGVGSGIPGEETFDCVERGLAPRDVHRHPAADLRWQLKYLLLLATDGDLLHQQVQFLEVGGTCGHPAIVIAVCIAVTLGKRQE